MSNSAHDSEINWYLPELRGQISIPNMHIPRRLKKNLRNMKINGDTYEIRINSDFKYVINSCAKQTIERKETWINKQIIDAYCQLNQEGYAHSVECWQNKEMVGALYGIALGGAFFGESMFCTARDASKIALAHLVARLHYAKFEILDTQFVNDHLKQFGVYEIPHSDYMNKLDKALNKQCLFNFRNIKETQLIEEYFND